MGVDLDEHTLGRMYIHLQQPSLIERRVQERQQALSKEENSCINCGTQQYTRRTW